MHLRTFASLVWAGKERKVRREMRRLDWDSLEKSLGHCVWEFVLVVMGGKKPQKVLRRGVSMF